MTMIDTAKIGKKGGKARAAAMTQAERKASAVAAIRARWDAYYREHPEKLTAKKIREAKKAARKAKGAK
jgi:hypothetical protein